jgi:carbonic anhydrase
MKIDQIFANNKVWITEKLKVDSDYFNNLSLGQSPEIL